MAALKVAGQLGPGKTVATLLCGPRVGVMQRGMTQVLIIMPSPWVQKDGWAVAADGKWWVLRSGDSPMLEVEGAATHPLDLSRAAVTGQDRERYLAAWKEAQRDDGEGEYVDAITSVEIEWPARKAPFVGGLTHVDPSGHLWVRVTDIEEPRPVYIGCECDGPSPWADSTAGRRRIGGLLRLVLDGVKVH